MMRPSLLIIEDHRDFRHAVCDFLKQNHVPLRILEASSGEEGVMIAHRAKPKLVLLDFWLGGINGMETANCIKLEDPKCAIIMLSMFDTKDINKLDYSKCINAFIAKSDLSEKLVPEIKKILSC